MTSSHCIEVSNESRSGTQTTQESQLNTIYNCIPSPGIVCIGGVTRRGRGRDGDGWQGRGSEGELSPSSCLGFQRGRGGGRWTDSDSLQPPSKLQICNPPDLEDLRGI
ncbi:hypothetical protein SLEP1_g45656 [Rubroshorea leprosula]|uniref:Uncharacterized protein n=1 Tax=Rubroshorea leprosula TaxID=152421 RepID=A0AAV5LJT6_9ROSI|nr:hypothetical protein SLEP1_g45656 [Rubroshorea leprosula]